VSAQWPSTPGKHTVEVRLDPDDAIAELDETNNSGLATFQVTADTVAPTSVASASPGANAAGWNKGNVSVSLSATDNAGGSGVRSITYAIGGTPTTVSGASTSFTVSSEGVTTISYFATDNVGDAEAAKTLVVRIDKPAPTGSLSLSPNVLRPPNHRLVRITPRLSTSDNLGGPVSVTGPTVTSNEPVNGRGDGNTSPDWVVSGSTLQLRAERAGGGTGRIYTVTYTLTDQAGNSSTLSGTVTVPRAEQDRDEDDRGDRNRRGRDD
jgi:hypothetical protein